MAIIGYEYRHRVGVFCIRWRAERERWVLYFNDENLGAYTRPDLALDDLIGGQCDEPACGDTSRLRLPDELGEWNVLLG